MTPTCDHTRRALGSRTSAITVCAGAEHVHQRFVCSICGDTIDWYDGLCVANPPARWRYCDQIFCLEEEAFYHRMPVDELIRCRAALRAKRLIAEDTFQRRRATSVDFTLPRSLLSSPEQQPYLDRGEACWCNLGKDCTGSHQISMGAPVNVCGDCGEEFKISKSDPHWATGVGPICPRKPPARGKA